jgi:Tol biopolymer transport system component
VSQTGVLAYQTGSGDVRSQLIWFDRTGNQIAALGDQADHTAVELSPDGTRAAVTVLDAARNARDIWLYDVATGLRTRFTFDPANDVSPVWSPDGSRVGFVSTRNGVFGLYVKASSGAGNEELLVDQVQAPASWSRDGRSLLYFERPTGPPGGSGLRVLPLSPDRKASVFLQTSFNVGVARFSPDGRWVAYQSNESGRNEVYVAPFPGPGGKWQVSTAGGTFPRWRNDGRELYYLAPDNRLMTASVNGENAAFSGWDCANPVSDASQAGAVERH